jgi:hypothetical protein
MESYRNDEVATLFRDMVRYSRMHHDSIVERARGVALPELRSWQYRWRQPPEAGGEEAFDPALTPYAALRYARENEFRAQAFYSRAAAESGEAEVQRLATEFAAEEAEHVAALDEWLARTPRPSATWSADPYTDE